MSFPSQSWLQWAAAWNQLDQLEAYVSQQVPFDQRGAALDAVMALRRALETARPGEGSPLRSGER